MADQVTSHCDRIVSNILSTYKMAIQHGTAENQEDTAKFIKLVEEVCRLEHLCENESNAETNTEFDNIDTIDKEFTDLIEQCQSSVTKQMIEASARYRNFMHEFDDLKAAASQAQATNKEARATTSNTTVIDEDLQMGTTESLIDPIAKTQIKNVSSTINCRTDSNDIQYSILHISAISQSHLSSSLRLRDHHRRAEDESKHQMSICRMCQQAEVESAGLDRGSRASSSNHAEAE